MFNRMAIPAASIIAAIAITFAAILTAPRAAQAADMKIASVDVRAIYENHPLKLQWEKQVAQEQESRNTKITEYLKKTYNLPDDPAKANLTDDQKKEIQTYLYEKNQEFESEK